MTRDSLQFVLGTDLEGREFGPISLADEVDDEPAGVTVGDEAGEETAPPKPPGVSGVCCTIICDEDDQRIVGDVKNSVSIRSQLFYSRDWSTMTSAQ